MGGNNMKKKLLTITLIAVLVTAIPSSYYFYSYNSYKNELNNALTLLENEKFDESITMYTNLEANKFSENDRDFIKSQINIALELKESKETYDKAIIQLENKDLLTAIETFKKVKENDKSRYELAKQKIVEAKNLYVSKIIVTAKDEASNGNYSKAIEELNILLEFDTNNEEVKELIASYNAELEKIKKEEEEKRLEEDRINSNSVNNSSGNNSSDSTSSSLGYSVIPDNNGWFRVKYDSGKLTPEGFGVQFMQYYDYSSTLNFNFIGVASEATYSITFHLARGPVTITGSTSSEYMSLSLEQGDLGKPIGISITAVYKGNTYTSNYSKTF